MVLLKQYVEQTFVDNWSSTPIHFYGVDFDSSGLDEWIQVKFSPLDTSYSDSLAECIQITGLVELYTYAKTLRDAMVLADNALAVIGLTTNYVVLSDVPTEQGTFDNNVWYVNQRFTVVEKATQPIQPIFYLVDSAGNFLVDGAGNRLTS